MRVAIILVLGLLLVGCGGNDNESSGGGKSTMDCEIGGDASKAELADLEDGKTHSVVVDRNKGSVTFGRRHHEKGLFPLRARDGPPALHDGRVRRPRPEGLLRWADVPPDRPRLR